jgi:ABC-2 type transport system permease protein
MRGFIDMVVGGRLVPLFIKELHQLRRNRRLVIMLIVPPTLQIILFGLALNPEVKNLRLGVVDDSRTFESRELVSAFNESLTFRTVANYASVDDLGHELSDGDLDIGLVIPKDFAKARVRGQTIQVQILLDATNSNTAAIAGGYASRVITAYNQRDALERRRAVITAPPTQPSSLEDVNGVIGAITPPPVITNIGGPPLARATITPYIVALYNPGLETSWFIATGMIGTLLVLMGSLVSAASMVREKEMGTIEQLLMTPAEASEIIVAKMAPLLLLLSSDIGIALIVCRLFFNVPIRGSLLLLVFAGVLCVFAGIGIGIFIATFTKSQQQAQLLAFFINPPIALLSGVVTPIEAMPNWLQPITFINPVRHFATISRGVLLKGIGLDLLYLNILMLAAAAIILVGFSVWHFRKQLG